MARIRSIKPEIRRSLVVSSWPYPVRWTFVGLPGYLDDSGRGRDDTRLLKAELYPLDDDMTGRKLDQHLQRIADTGPLCRYEVAGQRYLHITTWAEHQRVNRPSPSRFPPCPIHEDAVSAHGTITEPSHPRARACAPAEQGAGSREQGREQGVVVARDGNHDDDTAAQLLDEHLAAAGHDVSNAGRRQLHERITDCLNRASTDHTRDALRRYRDRASRGERTLPGLLPRLLDDVLAEAAPGSDVLADTLADPELLRAAGGDR